MTFEARKGWSGRVLGPNVRRASLASSPTIRGAPQRGFAIVRERRAQWSRNLRRCQAVTVLGWTKTRALLQLSQVRDSHAQRTDRVMANYSRASIGPAAEAGARSGPVNLPQ